MINYFKILRPTNLLITFVCILMTADLLDSLTLHITPFIIVILLIAGFANIVNDIIDYKIDKTNQLNRPICTDKISLNTAYIYASIILILALFIMFYYNFNYVTQQLILCINLPLIVLYTSFFKKIPLLGNLVIAFILSMVFITTVQYLNKEFYDIMPATVLAFLLMLIREIVKDIADSKGDAKYNIKTLAVKFGLRITFIIICLFTIILTLISVSFYFTHSSYKEEYLISLIIFVLFPLFYHIYKLYKNTTPTYCIYLSKVLKLITIFGVIVLYLTNV
ncbi:MAG: hypothetical protein CMD65_05030 [Gammaproteobacteria bacterium]|nr:hypothetical protein [Gammaproteobacteria bacterium]